MSFGIPAAAPALSKYCDTFYKKLDSGCYWWGFVDEKNLLVTPLDSLAIIVRFVINIVCLLYFWLILSTDPFFTTNHQFPLNSRFSNPNQLIHVQNIQQNPVIFCYFLLKKLISTQF